MSQMASTLWDKLTNIIPNGNILQLTSSKKGLFVECLTLVWRVWLATVHLTTGLMLEPESCRPSMIRTRTWNSSTCVMYGYAKQVYIGCLKLNWLRYRGIFADVMVYIFAHLHKDFTYRRKHVRYKLTPGS